MDRGRRDIRDAVEDFATELKMRIRHLKWSKESDTAKIADIERFDDNLPE